MWPVGPLYQVSSVGEAMISPGTWYMGIWCGAYELYLVLLPKMLVRRVRSVSEPYAHCAGNRPYSPAQAYGPIGCFI